MFLVLHQLLEQIARDIILDRMAMGRGLLVERCAPTSRPRGRSRASPSRSGRCAADRAPACSGKPSRKMMRSTNLSACCISSIDSLRHFLARILAAPIVEQAVMQPILVDGGQLVPQRLVEIFDDLGVALHGRQLLHIRSDGRRDHQLVRASLSVAVGSAERSRTASSADQAAFGGFRAAVADAGSRAGGRRASASSMILRWCGRSGRIAALQPRQP